MVNKTQPNNEPVVTYLNTIEPQQKRQDCLRLLEIMEDVMGEKARMWGDMIGVGTYHYKYETGREGDFFIIGFAPRSKNISIYATAYNEQLDKKKADLGKVKLGKSCIYINKLSDISEDKLRVVLKESIIINKERYP
ncbi:conserved hypothetical protein [Flavobacteria bacterium BBFL7]|nr:conserved hypothetical protein [Flavobacteria bacterium BBFL7]